MRPNKRSGHPGRPGTRDCWLAGCAQYQCVIAADIDPVMVDRRLSGKTGGRAFTPEERVEYERRLAERQPRDSETPVSR